MHLRASARATLVTAAPMVVPVQTQKPRPRPVPRRTGGDAIDDDLDRGKRQGTGGGAIDDRRPLIDYDSSSDHGREVSRRDSHGHGRTSKACRHGSSSDGNKRRRHHDRNCDSKGRSRPHSRSSNRKDCRRRRRSPSRNPKEHHCRRSHDSSYGSAPRECHHHIKEGRPEQHQHPGPSPEGSQPQLEGAPPPPPPPPPPPTQKQHQQQPQQGVSMQAPPQKHWRPVSHRTLPAIRQATYRNCGA